MKWFEYKQEVDALHAPDALKARLLSMEGTSAPAHDISPISDVTAVKAAPAGVSHSTPAKKHRGISWGHIAGLAACFAVGVFACDAFGWRVIPRMGAAMNSTAATQEYSPDASVSANGDYAAGAMADKGAMEDSAEAMTGTSDASPAEGGSMLGRIAESSASRKVIYTASLTVETKDYDASLAALDAAAKSAGGYAESVNEYNYDYEAGGSRSCNATYRIPAAQYDAFLAAVGSSGSVTSRSQTADDITADYVDVAARIEALETQRDRLLALEAQADDLDALLQIENSLSDVQYQLESYQSQRKLYDDQVDYCTVNLDLEEVEVYTPVEQPSFAARLGTALADALTNFVDGLGEFVLAIAGAWPVLILLAAGCGIGVTIHRRSHKKPNPKSDT